MRLRYALIAAVCVISACADPIEPALSDVDEARTAWEAVAPAAYTVDIAMSGLIEPYPGFVHVHVQNGVVVSARDRFGREVPDYPFTVEMIWDAVLDARSRDEINSARFDSKGVPIDVDLGRWINDSGVRYRTRAFRALR